MKAISLFSGIGGFDLGFERAGIQTVLQVEQDKQCLAVLQRHWPDVERVTDVRSVGLGSGEHHLEGKQNEAQADQPHASRTGDVSHGGQTSLIYGGFPCQDVSVAGKRAGLGGERSGLWFEFERILRELRPRWVCIENVAGLLSSNSGRDFGVILAGLDELGFHVAWAVLDAQHFGVAQRRRRVFIVGGPSRRAVEQVLSLCESCGGNPEEGGTPGEKFTGAIAVRTAQAGSNGWGVGSTAYTLDGSNGQAVLASSIQASAGHHGHSSPCGDGSDNLVLSHAIKSNTGQGHRADSKTDVALTLDADSARHHWQNHQGSKMLPRMFNASGAVRRLTPLECERLQGFPDGWTDGQADSHRYRQLGNAVAVPVAEWIGHRLMAVERSSK